MLARLSVIFAAWSLITLVLIYFFLLSRVQTNERNFILSASGAYDAVNEKIHINKTVLESLSALMRLSGDTMELRNLSAVMRNTFPHIYMIEFQQYVNSDDRDTFEKEQESKGALNYSLKDFDYDDKRIFEAVIEKRSYYPIYFLEPMGTAADIVVGLDLFAVPFLKDALIESIKTGRAVATKPFTLAEGGRGYILYKAIQANPQFDINAPTKITSTAVSVAIKTSSLLNYASEKLPKAKIRLIYKDSESADVEEIYAPNEHDHFVIHLGPIIHKRVLDDFGQPFHLEFSSSNGISLSELLICMFVMLVSLGGASLYASSSMNRHKNLMDLRLANSDLAQERKNLELNVSLRTKKIEEQKNDNSLLTQKIITLQEDEFRKIARELHDEFGQILTAINTNAKIIVDHSQENPIVLESGEDIRDYANSLYDSLHQIMSRLRPETLDTFGLQSAIEYLLMAMKLTQRNIQHEFTMEGDTSALTENQTITLYRCAQELINNSVKHSQSNSFAIHLLVLPGWVRLSVNDSGVRARGTEIKKGFGLLGLEERVRSLGGEVDINNTHGWRVIITFPARPNKKEGGSTYAN